MITLTCPCCGHQEEYLNRTRAFEAGWDLGPWEACPLCPGVCLLEIATHEKAHAYWKEHGRPKAFGRDCVTDEHWDQNH